MGSSPCHGTSSYRVHIPSSLYTVHAQKSYLYVSSNNGLILDFKQKIVYYSYTFLIFKCLFRIDRVRNASQGPFAEFGVESRQEAPVTTGSDNPG